MIDLYLSGIKTDLKETYLEEGPFIKNLRL
jgi:hypothetical protein